MTKAPSNEPDPSVSSGPPPSVDPVTGLLNRQDPAFWSLNLYAAAREAGGTFVPSRPYPRSQGVRGESRNPERAREEAARRARGRLRRYCAANRLNRLGTLTYRGEGCHDEAIVRTHIGDFFRQLRDANGGKPFPYAWVTEWHKTGHGLHVHFAVGQFIQRSRIESAWPHGFVHIKLIGDLPTGSGSIAEARVAAGYLSKYVTKSFTDAGRSLNQHRYDLAQGFLPKRIALHGSTREDVIRQACDLLGAHPVAQWFSTDTPDWRGAPAFWLAWD